MIQNKSVLAMIPARGGSKGVSRKNIRQLSDKPLIAWSIEEAKKSKYIDRLVVSTEDIEIAEIAKAWGAEIPFMRPMELALDTTPGIDPVLHTIEMLPNYDYIVMLQPTSPLRTAEDIDRCLECCINQDANACVSVTLTDKSPYWMYQLSEENALLPVIVSDKPVLRRQDAPDVYVLNGAVYVARTSWLKNTKSFLHEETIGYPMPKDRSVDVDTMMDILIIETILREKKKSGAKSK
ncbi:acylneuraminate cytidylyltransferase family protein [Brevibacillus antibioticus]|uniref:Acylneuraminate cytidylyltransferase family protein n=1 Tax=Brevibacillus antibioticus TaxID=2570228 RepID=A0A4U2YEN4_9BACL|nr:acylneuraminate cytidylyltransferase family protein [Brevibacillus antibioticus]TKI58592.1 acylneuraminate cytidylyltransferase family protein [Brevibacillus antibioticus]